MSQSDNTLFHRFLSFFRQYPRQFWLMFLGMLLSTVGASMIWPFLMIYVGKTLHVEFTEIAWLITVGAVAGLVGMAAGGMITDFLGRKWVMVISLAVNAVGYILLSQARSIEAFAAIQALNGFFNPLYRVGGDAMMADLIPPEKRTDAYALLRLSNNLGIAVGPAISGYLVTQSYTVAFFLAAAGLFSYGLLMAFYARETLRKPSQPVVTPADTSLASPSLLSPLKGLAGYSRILKDTNFLAFVGVFAINQICAVLLWVLMAPYANQHFGIAEDQYRLVPITNALMVVCLQMPITLIAKRFPERWVMALGGLFYALSVGSVALAHDIQGFWISIVIMTLGELLLVPTSSTFVANLAPADMRGRYMSIYGLTWPISSALAPLLGGAVGKLIGPTAIWTSGMGVGMISTLLFAWMAIAAAQKARKSLASQLAEETIPAD